MTMARSTRGKVFRYILEIGRWVLVGYLLFPLRRRMHLPLEFTRTALGIALFVIFSGKLLYDFVIWSRRPASTRDLPKELLTLLATVVIITALVGAVVVFIGLYVVNMVQEMRPEM